MLFVKLFCKAIKKVIVLKTSKMNAIFQASIDIFSEKGFEKATMDEIAARANVAKGTIYYHFKSKEELFLFLVEEGVSVLVDAVQSRISNVPHCKDKLMVVLEEQLFFFQTYNDFCVILLRESWGAEDRQLQFRKKINSYTHIIETILRQGIDANELDPIDTVIAAYSIFGSISLTSLHILMKEGSFDIEFVKSQLQPLLLQGLPFRT